ncbi:MAG: GGDEF domain-containing protein [Acidimicrobiales bacterium]|nr:GGDEF domain-containing protein [Acidimicrobiales bacterium]
MRGGAPTPRGAPSGYLRRPHVRIAAVFLLFALTGVTVLSVVLLSSRRVERELDLVNLRLAPAARQLDQVSRQMVDAQVNFELGTAFTDPTSQGAYFAEAAFGNEAVAVAWDDYLAMAVGLPGEAAAQQRYEQELQRLNELGQDAGLLLLSSNDALDPDLLAKRAEIQTQFLRAYDQLQAIRDGLYQPAVAGALATAHRRAQEVTRNALLAAAAGALIVAVAGLVNVRATRRRETDLAAIEAARAAELRRNEFEARLQRALEMAANEEAAFGVVEGALREAAPDRLAEVLVADSSRAHFRQVLATSEHAVGGCEVVAPFECPAAHSSQTLVFASSDALDACPKLKDRAAGPCSAVCAPISIAGNAVGVIHVVGPERDPLAADAVSGVELVARKGAERIGMIRAFARSETQARTDPLTGLLNRRSVENAVNELEHEGVPYAVVFGDLDRFKELNDVHGHDVGDRALRLFSRVLRDSVRPSDIPARYGGEEFLVVLPHCSATEAVAVVERVRAQLRAASGGGLAPAFTASFGVASSSDGRSFEDVVGMADQALLFAKANGRDRVAVAGEDVGLGESEPVGDGDGSLRQP